MRRITTAVLATSLTLIATAGADAQLSGSWSGEEGQPGSLQPVNPGTETEVQIVQCFEANLFSIAEGLVSIDVTAENPNGDWGVSFELSIVDTPEELVNWLAGFVVSGPPIPILPCPPTLIEDYGRLSGSASLYSFAIGGGMSGGFTYIRRATTTVEMNMPLEIFSETQQTIELPISISGDVFAAESFGDPAQTRGYAKLTLSGSVAGVSVNETVEVESVSVIPEQDSINFNQSIPVVVQPGLNTIHVSVSGEAEIEAVATSAGIFGSLSGAATAGVNLPNSIRIRRFTGAGGGPLPPGIIVRNPDTGVVYENTADPACPADLNADGVVDADDFFLFLSLFASGDPRADINADGVIDADDFFAYLALFAAGC
ncbi:MAG: hypothetical protein JJU33_10915 [Phycisphaerales bacterium]|nr:hypothetical protein [Phycisphaerales bacterium]